MRPPGRQLFVVVALAVLGTVLATAGVAASPDAASAETSADAPAFADDHVGQCAATPPSDLDDPDNPEGVVGWVEGYWYSEPVEVTP